MTHQPFGCQSVDGIVLALVRNGWAKGENLGVPVTGKESLEFEEVHDRPNFHLDVGGPGNGLGGLPKLVLFPNYGDQQNDVGLWLAFDPAMNLVVAALMFECYAGNAIVTDLGQLATLPPTPEAVGLLLHRWEQSWHAETS